MQTILRARAGGRTSMLSLLAATAAALLLLLGALASSAQAAVGAFTERAASSAPLTSVAIDTATNTIYAQANEGTKFYSYSPQTNEWTELPEAPLSSGNNGGATYLNGKIYTSYTGEATDIGVYDIATKSWSTIANPLKEGTADITATGEQLYMAVGSTFVSYNPATEATVPLAEPKLSDEECNHGFEAWGGLQPYQGKIYGDQGDGCYGFGVYDIATNEWTRLPEVPRHVGSEEVEGPVAGSALDPITGTYYAYGGYNEDHLFEYRIQAGEWTMSTMPFKVDDGGMAYVSLPGLTGIYAIQGQEATAFTWYATHETAAEASLAMSLAPGTAPTSATGEVIYTITAANAGPSTATSATVSDPLPAGMTLISAAASQGSCSGTSTVTCSLGNLAAGGTATVTIKATTATTGTVTNTATLSSTEFDPFTGNNSASVSALILVTPAPAPVIVKEVVSVPAPAPVVKCMVPKLRGMGLHKAKKALAKAHCKLGKLRHRHARKIRKHKVISQSRRPGSKLAAGSKVGLVVSLGKKKHHGKKHGHSKKHSHGKHKGKHHKH